MKNGMKMVAGGAVLAGLLASCGVATTPDGSASVTITNLRTEYVDAATGGYVACDNVFGTFTSTNRTAVAINFKTTGSVQSVDIGLRGATTTSYDGNYNTNTSSSGLTYLGNGAYQTTFYADSSQGLLPQSIVVNPVGAPPIEIKYVTPTTEASGSFYTRLAVYSTTGDSASTDSRLSAIPNVKVYASCNYVRGTGSTL